MHLMATQEQRRAIHADYGRTVETVSVDCSKCFRSKKARCDHRLSDAEIARKHFSGWTIIGVRGAKRTRCPQCRNQT
jgi:hypothetical protein